MDLSSMDLSNTDQPIIWYAVAGLAFVVVLFLAFATIGKRKTKPSPAKGSTKAATKAEHPTPTPTPTERAPVTAPAAATNAPTVSPATDEIAVSFRDAQTTDWPVYDQRFREGVIVDGHYRMSGGDGVRSKGHLIAEVGATYRVEFTALALRNSGNGVTNNFAIGPLFLNASGKVLNHWVKQPAIKDTDGEKQGYVEGVAPETAATVHIAMGRSLAREGIASDGLIAISAVKLSKITLN